MVDFLFGLFKIFLLAGLVALGVVFLPDGIMTQVEQKVGVVQNYLQEEVAKRSPGLTEELGRKVAATKEDIDRLYQSFQEKTLPSIKNWIWNHQIERQ